MTERLRHALDEYRTRTQQPASPGFVAETLDRLGLADRYTTVESALGTVFVSWNPHGVSALRRADDAEAFERWFQKRFARRALPAKEPDHGVIDHVRRALAGEKVKLAVDLRDCTPFEAAVLEKAREIPRGHARPYAWIAREIERPRAVRAVGTALANNPVPLLIPCHRVVRSDYTCGDYVFGSERKRQLLEREGLHLDEVQELARRGVRFIAQPEYNCFCLPTCGSKVLGHGNPCFHTADEALALGLKPCGVCRPIAA